MYILLFNRFYHCFTVVRYGTEVVFGADVPLRNYTHSLTLRRCLRCLGLLFYQIGGR